MKAIGYSPVGLISNSDHRSIFVNFNPQQLFGTRPNLQHPILRNVRSNNKHSVTMFVENMYDHMKEHNLFSRAQHLTTGGTGKLAESIDVIVGQAGDLGEKRCRKRRPEWYSVELVQERLTVSLLQHFLKGLHHGQDRSEVIVERLQQIQSPIVELSLSIPATQKLIAQHTALPKTKADNS